MGTKHTYKISGSNISKFHWSLSGGGVITSKPDSNAVDIEWGNTIDEYILSVYGENTDGCTSDTMKVLVQLQGAPIVDLVKDKSICEGQSFTYDAGFANATWKNNPLLVGQYFTSDRNDTITVVVKNDNGCITKDSTTLKVNPNPIVNLPLEMTVCGPNGEVLDAQNSGAIFRWSSGEISQSIVVHEGEKYITVDVEDENTCTTSATVHIKGCDLNDFIKHVPIAFTPNRDGKNESWNVPILKKYPKCTVEIYDRWGRLVFRSENGYTKDWDGKSIDGKELPMDTYLYIIKPNERNLNTYTGTVTIVR